MEARNIRTLEVLDKGFSLVNYEGAQVIMKAGKIVSQEEYKAIISGERRSGFEWFQLDSNELNDILDTDIDMVKLYETQKNDAYGKRTTVGALYISEDIKDSYILNINTTDNLETTGTLRYVLGEGDIAYQLDKHRPELYDEYVSGVLETIGMTLEVYNSLPMKEFKGYSFFREWIYDGYYYKITNKGNLFYGIKKLDEVSPEVNVGSAKTNEAKESAVRVRFI